MDFYDEMRDVASELLAEFRQGVVTLTRPGSSVSGANAWEPPITSDPAVHELDATVKGVAEQFVDGTTILATDLQVMTAVPPIVPSLETDTMMIDGKTVTIVRVDPIPAAGTPVAYRFIVRG